MRSAADCFTFHRSLLLAAVLVFSSLSTVEGWGKEGHEIIGNIAYQRLSTKSQSIINNIVRYDDWHYHQSKHSSLEEEMSPLGKIANWADQVRLYYKWSSKLHFVDIRDDEVINGCHPFTKNEACVFSYKRDCENDVCAVGAIVNYTNQIATYCQHHQQQNEGENAPEQHHAAIRGAQARQSDNSNNSMHLLLKSLKFLTHFMGDIHQPLHVSRTSDRGGNNIGVKILHHHHHSHPPPLLHIYSHPTVDRYGNAYNKNGHDHPHHYSHNLHSIWDKTIIEYAIHTYFNASQTLFQQSIYDDITAVTQINNNDDDDDDDHNNNFSSKCTNALDVKCVSTWAEESWVYALQYAYANIDGTEILQGAELTEEYFEDRLKIVKKQLGMAGIRLANVLEMALNGMGEEMEEESDGKKELWGNIRGSLLGTDVKASSMSDKFALDAKQGLMLV